jgi:hypothetical protein
MPRQEAATACDGEVAVRRIRLVSYPHGEEPKGVEWLEPFREGP